MSIKNVLVVDDQSNWREVLKMLLEEDMGLQVYVAGGAKEAKDMISSINFALAILDIRLEAMDPLNIDGLELQHFLKEHSPNTKTVIITGYNIDLFDKYKDTIKPDMFIYKINIDIKEFKKIIKKLLI